MWSAALLLERGGAVGSGGQYQGGWQGSRGLLGNQALPTVYQQVAGTRRESCAGNKTAEKLHTSPKTKTLLIKHHQPCNIVYVSGPFVAFPFS